MSMASSAVPKYVAAPPSNANCRLWARFGPVGICTYGCGPGVLYGCGGPENAVIENLPVDHGQTDAHTGRIRRTATVRKSGRKSAHRPVGRGGESGVALVSRDR